MNHIAAVSIYLGTGLCTGWIGLQRERTGFGYWDSFYLLHLFWCG